MIIYGKEGVNNINMKILMAVKIRLKPVERREKKKTFQPKRKTLSKSDKKMLKIFKFVVILA